MTVVFDFDKTLTNYDTLFGFYKLADTSSKKIFVLKRIILIFAAVLYKLKLISNSQLKSVGVHLFLNGMTREYINDRGKVYAAKIQLNGIYRDDYLSTPKKERLVISASLIEYLQYVFPDEKVFASSLKFSGDDKVIGLNNNMYANEKVATLKKEKINAIDVLYTDSFSDRGLMKIATRVVLIKNEVKKIIKG